MSARGRGRRRGGHEEEEHINHERWAISYMDMVTVMMCLFIVLFAISQVDQVKFTRLAESLGAAFGSNASELNVLDGGEGLLDAARIRPEAFEGNAVLPNVPPVMSLDDEGEDAGGEEGGEGLDEEAAAEAAQQAALLEISGMEELRNAIRSDLEAEGLADEVAFRLTERGLVIGLVTENVFFEPASAHLPATTEQVIDVLAGRIYEVDNLVDIEGHANILQHTDPYPTNWELSGDRAIKVLRRLEEHGGISPQRLRALAYGDAHPTFVDEPNALDLNRRVDVVILSEAPEAVRDAVREILEQTAEGS